MKRQVHFRSLSPCDTEMTRSRRSATPRPTGRLVRTPTATAALVALLSIDDEPHRYTFTPYALSVADVEAASGIPKTGSADVTTLAGTGS